MTESEIQIKIADSNLLIAYFSQPECNICKTLRPKIEVLVADYTTIDFQYIDTQICSILRGQYLIFTVPTIILFYQGREVKRWSRYLSVEEVKIELDNYMQITNGTF
jgi:thioredoxin-like negative regulator of GroEL